MSVEEDYVDAIEKMLKAALQKDQSVKTISGNVYLSRNPRYLEGRSASEEDAEGKDG
jgi:hypothetical protein